MKNLSVKRKILILIITLSVLSLSIFAFFTFQTYKKDKLAFVYESLTKETKSQSALLADTASYYDFFLGSIISGTDLKTRSLPYHHLKFLEKNSKVSALYLYAKNRGSFKETTLFESQNNESVSWENIKKAPVGLSLVREKSGTFLFKKALTENESFAALTFKKSELTDLFKSELDSESFILNMHVAFKESISPTIEKHKDLIISEINKNPVSSGLVDIKFENERYLLSFSRPGFQDFILISMIKEKKVLLVQEVFINQVIIFLTFITSVSLLIGTLSARWLTWHLDQLSCLAGEFEVGNFEAQIDVDGEDELGRLGQTFNSLGKKIKYLMSELKKYNTELESIVQERTSELKSLTNIQKAMLDSLGQGFVIVTKDHKIQDTYSKVATEMFEVIPDEVLPHVIMGVQEEEANTFKDLFELAFTNALDFSDMVSLAPETRTNSKDQKIFLNYSSIRNEESGDLDYVLIIGTDRTAEMESLEKFKKEWNFSQMITKVAGNRFSLNRMLSESLGMLKTAFDDMENNRSYALREVQRLVHTLKGNVSYFHIEEIRSYAHEFESYLEDFYNLEVCPLDLQLIVLEKIMSLNVLIECYIDKFDSIIQYKDSKESKLVPTKDLDSFGRILKSKDRELFSLFKSSFYKTKIGPHFQIYPMIVKEIGIMLNKEVRFEIEGGDLDLPEGNWSELFQQFIHVIRNAIDHGIETPLEREQQGKKREGVINFKFSTTGESLKVTLEDDGRGLDWQAIAAKDPGILCEEDAIEKIKTGGISSKSDVSDISGRGVGMSSVFMTVEKWDGKIKLINRVKKGMVLEIEIPFRSARQQTYIEAA